MPQISKIFFLLSAVVILISNQKVQGLLVVLDSFGVFIFHLKHISYLGISLMGLFYI